MTHDLTTRLAGTLSGLKLGLPISALNRLRRRDEEQRKMTDARETIYQLALVTDCAAEIRQRDATIAELAAKLTKAKGIAHDLLIVIQCHADKLNVTSADVAAIGPMDASEITSLREWLAQWPLGADIVPMPRTTVARLLDFAQHGKDATIAELRGRVAALEAMTPGGVR